MKSTNKVMMKHRYFSVVTEFSLLWFGLAAYPALPVLAASYDYYVQDGSSGNGSSSDPFGSITDAIDELKESGGKKIYVSQGSYGAAFTLPKGAELVGSDTKEVSITALIRMEDGSKLSEVSVSSGGSILALDGADVTISKVRVKNAPVVGIKAEAGRGTITIRDSVIEGSRQGLYMQAGNELRFEGLEVRDNREEGIDIRENVSGSIKKSTFRNNGESGIEIVLGEADLVIGSNTFTGNSASGIATQFFHGAKKTGDVRIEDNQMSKNDYGIDCKAPQGGTTKLYYLNSLRITGNTFANNREGEIAKRCKIMTDEERIAFEEEEKRKALEQKETTLLSLGEEVLIQRATENAISRQAYDDERKAAEHTAIEQGLGVGTALLNQMKENEQAFFSRSPTVCFLIGSDTRSEASLQRALENTKILFERLEKREETLQFDANKRAVEEVLGTGRTQMEALDKRLEQPPCGFSLFGWATRFIHTEQTEKNIALAEVEKNASSWHSTEPAELLFLGSIAYHPQLRKQIVNKADAFMLDAVRDDFRRYTLVIGDLSVPLLNDADPVPPLGSKLPVAFPARFANVFAASNIRLMHLGNSSLFARELQAGYEKTALNLSQAGVDSFGGFGDPSLEPMKKMTFPEGFIALLDYRESKTSTSETLIEQIKAVKQDSQDMQAIVVYITWDTTQGTKLTDKRKELARSFIDAGATLVLGSGLSIPPESESYQSGKIYYAQGSILDDTVVGLEKEAMSLGVVLKLKNGEAPILEERVLFFTQEDGLGWKE